MEPLIKPTAPRSLYTARKVSSTPQGTGDAWILVFTVSIGYMPMCSITPAQLPAVACCQKGVELSLTSQS
eukprot:CAMPEP_0115367562 /NCGR_PEP_ID=MMETSP0270-20121206/105377_1 /TAXON_ID=71861 /ORGANISM="Scrippsiella trochoidea, Strain CCMP3099" /LENGTH=69 /DNA_ID=CAMNT_0002790353 /DNA_START=606 /DNA_END=815 /DNA_ORIENTATION=+